jgi:hypothetical protein
VCSPNIYLSTNPDGTLAFGNVNVGASVNRSLQVKNNEPAGSLNLSRTISGGNAKSFSVISGSCTTISKLKAGQTCTYKLKLKGKKKDLGAVQSTFIVAGAFKKGVCPAGDVQSVSTLLAGFVQEPSGAK